MHRPLSFTQTKGLLSSLPSVNNKIIDHKARLHATPHALALTAQDGDMTFSCFYSEWPKRTASSPLACRQHVSSRARCAKKIRRGPEDRSPRGRTEEEDRRVIDRRTTTAMLLRRPNPRRRALQKRGRCMVVCQRSHFFPISLILVIGII